MRKDIFITLRTPNMAALDKKMWGIYAGLEAHPDYATLYKDWHQVETSPIRRLIQEQINDEIL